MTPRRCCVLVALAIVLLAPRSRGATGHSVEEVLASFRLAQPDLLIEAAAAEPDVLDPVDVAWDEAGRMYVVEMRDYPSGPGAGAIRRLEDADGDGRYERATVYAEGLSFPSACLPWRGGLLVTAAPDILWLKDSDGDGRSDERRVVLTGFALGDQQLRVNGLMFGLDGWIYAANGRLGGKIRRPEEPESKGVSIARSDLRFDPDTGEFEALAGPSQFGLARDNDGNRFLSWNTIPIRHAVIESRFLEGAVGAGASGIAAIIPSDDTGRVYPIAGPERRHNRESVEFFNATCGTMIYRGDAIPSLRGDMFVCESLGSLVHHRKLARSGATFVASRVEEGREFLASTDSWFRPVNLESGPDGALYVVDMCRKEIEHPDFISESFRQGMDFRAGDDLGRIWRVRARAAEPRRAARSLAALEASALADAPTDTNGWTRDTAQRLMIEKADSTCVEPLRALASKGPAPETRLAALWTLAALDRREKKAGAWLSDETLRQSLRDAEGRVRKGAVQVLQERGVGGGKWDADLLRLASDPEISVRLETGLASSALEKEPRFNVAKRIVEAGAGDEWLHLAVVIAAKAEAWELAVAITEIEASGGEPTEAGRETLFDLARAAAMAAPEKPAAAFAEYCACDGVSPDSEIAMLAGFLAGLEIKRVDPLETLKRAETGNPSAVPWFIKTASETALSEEAAIPDRARAVRALSLAPKSEANPVFLKLLGRSAPEALRAEAARAISRSADAATVELLLADWNQLAAETRRALMVDLARRPETARALVAAADAGRISRIELRGAAGEALANHPDKALREAATRLFASGGDRAGVVAKYRAALPLTGDATRGSAQFARNCVACHRMQGLGHAVGPDLSGIASRAKDQLLSDILDPSAEVAPDFVNHIAVAKDGEIISGLLAREGPGGVTLRQAQESETTIAAARLAEFRASAVSLMPEGFEDAMDLQAMSDLLEFLHHGERGQLARAIEASAETGASAK